MRDIECDIARDFDARFGLDMVDAFVPESWGGTGKATSERHNNGKLVLSAFGLHFYYNDSAKTLHIPFVDIFPSKKFVDKKVRLFQFSDDKIPLSGAPLPKVVRKSGIIGLAYRKLMARDFGVGKIFVGYNHVLGDISWIGLIGAIRNWRRATMSQDLSDNFIRYLPYASSKAPPYPNYIKKSAYALHFEYYARACAMGPAISFADQAIEAYKQQVRKPLFGRSIAERRNTDFDDPLFVPLTLDDMQDIERKCAWLLIDAKQYQEVLQRYERDSSHIQLDASITLSLGLANAMLGKLEAARACFLAPHVQAAKGPVTISAIACARALSGERTSAQSLIEATLGTASHDYHALFLCAFSHEIMGNFSRATALYDLAASSARGIYQGSAVAIRGAVLAERQSNQLASALRMAEQLPNNRDAWEILRNVARSRHDTALEQRATTHINAWKGKIQFPSRDRVDGR